MLAEDKLGREPVAIGIFVVEDNDAFPVTIVDHLQQSLERIVFPFLLFPTLELKKKFTCPFEFLHHSIPEYVERINSVKGEGETYNSCPVSCPNTYAPSFS